MLTQSQLLCTKLVLEKRRNQVEKMLHNADQCLNFGLSKNKIRVTWSLTQREVNQRAAKLKLATIFKKNQQQQN